MHDFTFRLHNDHGLLHHHNGELVFGFIHGNWALDNSRPDGHWCGVTSELKLLRDLGCYADFTMPSIPSPTQSRIFNSIYWTAGDPTRPRGFEATVGVGRQGDLLMIEDPGGLHYSGCIIPRVETEEVAPSQSVTSNRIKRWLELAPQLGKDIFVKLFGHDAREDNAAALLGTNSRLGNIASMFRSIHAAVQQRNLELHWVSVLQMSKAVDALIQSAKPPAEAHQL